MTTLEGMLAQTTGHSIEEWRAARNLVESPALLGVVEKMVAVGYAPTDAASLVRDWTTHSVPVAALTVRRIGHQSPTGPRPDLAAACHTAWKARP